MERFIKVHYLDEYEPTLLNSSNILLIDQVEITRDNITRRCTRIMFFNNFNNSLKPGYVKESVEDISKMLNIKPIHNRR